MTPKLYKAADVCELTELQPYVLRSWEKEFPGIGVQKSEDGPRLYRQSDVDQVLRIKQLVFGEGLTLAGARRRLEDERPGTLSSDDAAQVIEVLSADARSRIMLVRDGLRSLLHMLSSSEIARDRRAGDGVSGHSADDYRLTPPPVESEGSRARPRPIPARRNPQAQRSNASSRPRGHGRRV